MKVRYTGRVKWWNDAKGYGFLTPDAGGEDVFVHYSAVRRNGHERRTLEDDDAVEFDIVQGQKGPQADGVTKLA
jgi:CspA family cold shock protein